MDDDNIQREQLIADEQADDAVQQQNEAPAAQAGAGG